MKDLKIRVSNEAESKEAQELFFELGGTQVNSSRIGMVAANDGVIYPDVIGNWDEYDGKEITLQELRDMVNPMKEYLEKQADGSYKLVCGVDIND